jgi:hypothetical protein
MRRVRVAVAVAALLMAPTPLTARDEPCIVLEDFSAHSRGAFPDGWRVREEPGTQVYSIQSEWGIRFLKAKARNVGIQAARERDWDLREYPILRWKWRPRVFPQGADERAGKNDSAAAVYVVFHHTPVSVKALKYVWSERVPKGTELESSLGLTQVLVMETGAPRDRSQWFEERVNIARDYRRRFNESDVPRPAGLAVLTDSDDTASYAEGDYADFRACRE